MKFILAFILSVCLFSTSKSQISISCDYQSYCQWNENLKKFQNCNGYDASSMFSFNEKETMFTHTTSEMTSTYYITKSSYNEELDIFTYDVVSDVGNDYVYVVDMKNKEIRALFHTEGKTYMVIFVIKSMFKK